MNVNEPLPAPANSDDTVKCKEVLEVRNLACRQEISLEVQNQVQVLLAGEE